MRQKVLVLSSFLELHKHQLEQILHRGPENLKKSRPKKIHELKEINFMKKFFWSNSIFYHFKIGQKSIFELRKSLKQPKMQFHEKKIFDVFDFMTFFARTFLNFLARCGFELALYVYNKLNVGSHKQCARKFKKVQAKKTREIK